MYFNPSATQDWMAASIALSEEVSPRFPWSRGAVLTSTAPWPIIAQDDDDDDDDLDYFDDDDDDFDDDLDDLDDLDDDDFDDDDDEFEEL